MFQPFGLVVNFVPRVVEEVMEETLQQAVVAKDLQGAPLPGCRQTHAVVLFVSYKRGLLRRELLEHSSNGCGADAKMPRERVAGHPFLFRPGQFQDRFQIVVHGFRVVRPVAFKWH